MDKEKETPEMRREKMRQEELKKPCSSRGAYPYVPDLFWGK